MKTRQQFLNEFGNVAAKLSFEHFVARNRQDSPFKGKRDYDKNAQNIAEHRVGKMSGTLLRQLKVRPVVRKGSLQLVFSSADYFDRLELQRGIAEAAVVEALGGTVEVTARLKAPRLKGVIKSGLKINARGHVRFS